MSTTESSSHCAAEPGRRVFGGEPTAAPQLGGAATEAHAQQSDAAPVARVTPAYTFYCEANPLLVIVALCAWGVLRLLGPGFQHLAMPVLLLVDNALHEAAPWLSQYWPGLS